MSQKEQRGADNLAPEAADLKSTSILRLLKEYVLDYSQSSKRGRSNNTSPQPDFLPRIIAKRIKEGASTKFSQEEVEAKQRSLLDKFDHKTLLMQVSKARSVQPPSTSP